jgi:hypothetical protein
MRLLLFALALLPTALHAQVPAAADSALARELDLRVKLDQDARNLMNLRNVPGKAMSPEDIRLVMTVDSLNTAWLKEVVETRGWPKRSDVGKEAAHDAWLLAQHADHDTAFQAKVLRLLKTAVDEGEATGSELAYLTDRVRVARGEPQLYGTQFRGTGNGAMEPAPIEDPEHVDERRAAVGLPPMREYLKQIEEFYGHPAE